MPHSGIFKNLKAKVLCAKTIPASFKAAQVAIDDTAKRDLTIFWKLLTVIPCAPKDFQRLFDDT